MILLGILTGYLLTGIVFALHSYRQDGRVLIAIASVPLWWLVFFGIMVTALFEKEEEKKKPEHPRARVDLH